MRVCQERQYKLIWNLAWRLEYPFSADLWASSTWQSIYRNKVETFGKRKVTDYLFRTEFELYNLKNDPDEIHNLAGDKAYSAILDNQDRPRCRLSPTVNWHVLIPAKKSMEEKPSLYYRMSTPDILLPITFCLEKKGLSISKELKQH